ncbi:diguanylate cyclase [Romboutsia lituseburensis]|uniref:bifunctional diguanylate cyclase/phosphohydrolase n=1 Tax=Romboutsia lituseburensis TaxID=1537 RepID=UPI00215A55FB|nr:diguanylate cyclase [Romboutsia lituseburensis]MCR8745340.1 diguanylate cyclase [Romboutsia lituseburensis]
MSNFDQVRNKKVFEIIVVLKVIYIILSLIAILSYLSPKMDEKNIIIISLVGSSVLIFMMLYFVLMTKRYDDKKSINSGVSEPHGVKPEAIDYIETIVMLLIFYGVLVITGVEESDYKLIGIFIVLISAIQFGKNYSIAVSVLCFIFIMIIDFSNTTLMPEDISTYFEKDLILSTAIFIVAFITGMYVDIEREHCEELKNLANKDELTGLYNHRFFQEYLENAITNAQNNGKEVSLLFMDIDYFKNYNDINGHQAGDLLLKQIGKILKNSVRKNDIVARYGGEEFAAVLPNTNEEDAIKIGERIRTAIQNTTFRGQENQPDKNITISIGVSSYPTRAISKSQLINTADDALYRAKSFNKNRVESYHSILDDLCKQMNIQEDTIKSLKTFISMINLKDRYTYGHTERVVIYVKWFAQILNLKEEEQIQIQIAAYLHDIGKLEIPENVLNKRGKLTDEEFQMFRNHPQVGVDLINHINPFKAFVPIIKHHHERYDGYGYPDRLKGDKIPYLARMITIADSFDAMTSNRPYNIRKTHEEGIEELRKNAGMQFDPDLVEKFIEMLEKYKDNF